MMENAWLIPLFPLLSFLILLLFGKRLKEASAYVGILLTLASLVYSILVLFERFTEPTYITKFDWLTIGDMHLTAGFEVNQLNALMLFIVSLVSFLVHTYSKGYMQGDERFPVFYAYLGLFTFAMLGSGHFTKPTANLYFLGTCRCRFLPINRFLFLQRRSEGCREKSVHYDPYRGRRLIYRHDSFILGNQKLRI